MTTNLSILLVDNEEFILDASKKYLQQFLSVEVACALSGQAALEMLAVTRYDAVVADFDMAVMNGIDLLKTIRSNGDDIPFIVFTGKGREEVIIEAFENGADAYVQKGVEIRLQFTVLISKVTAAIDKRRLNIAFKSESYPIHNRYELGNGINLPAGDTKIYIPQSSLESKNRAGDCTRSIPATVYDELKREYDALEIAHEKMHLLSSATRHDMLNTITTIKGYMGFLKEKNTEPAVLSYIYKLNTLIGTIQSQIDFTRDYQNIGILKPTWQYVDHLFHRTVALHAIGSITVTTSIAGLRIYADPLLEKVFYNLVDNSLRHGGAVHEISCYWCMTNGGIILVYEDDGVGIPKDMKTQIFKRGVGSNSGLGLFLAREIAAITKIQIDERGNEKCGARFEMFVPEGGFRFSSDLVQ
ncbi:MAG TPA: hybrid sensor histidine kinase/response regulator [Methanospirillum sp.]|nr:hybrid sensor histidine kinase/response regulator [Methanospirillum sp.]